MTHHNNPERRLGFSTRQLHAGYTPEATTGSRAVPIYQTTAYNLQSTERAARLFALEETGNIYTRISNPTSNVLEQRMANLEGGVGALEVSSGHAAQTTAIFAICQAGDHIVSAATLYGGTVSQFKFTFPRLGIDVTFVDPADPENFRRAVKENTKIIYGETLGNPLVNVFPLEAAAKVAQEYHIPLMIDNTLATPYLCRPFEWGANIITHSTTKYCRRAWHQHGRRDRGRRQLRLAARALSRISPSPTLPTTVFPTRTTSGRWRSFPRRGPGSCAISAPASRHSTPGC
jgi:O-acetylhomoserine (thiol)-lyase